MAMQEQIFMGSRPARTRAFLCGAFRELAPDYARLVVPCVGAYAIPFSTIAAG